MTIQADYFSILFFLVLCVYALIGSYVLTLNPKSSLNRIFFLFCLSLCIWAFSFAMGNAVADYQSALFFRRLGALGWGILYSFLLHYCLLLTESEFLKSKIAYVFIYLPSVLNIVFFGLYTPVAITQYNLIATEAGWINVSQNGIGDIYFNVYYMLFSFLGVLTLWSWKDVVKNSNRRNTALVISSTFILSFMAGTMTDIIINQFFYFKTPQLAVVFALLPMLGVLYSIKKHSLMFEFAESKVNEFEIINFENRLQFYGLLSSALAGGSVLNIFHYFYYSKEIQSVLILSVVLLFIAFSIKLIPLVPLKHKTQDFILFVVLSLLIIVFFMSFTEAYGNNIVWPIPIIFLFLSAVFRQKKYFFMILFVSLSLHFISWIVAPNIAVKVDSLDYISHIFFYVTIAFMGSAINKIYQDRLIDYKKQNALQKEIALISASFVSINNSNINHKINEMLKNCGVFFDVDRTYFFKGSQNLTYENEWCCEPSFSALDRIRHIAESKFLWKDQLIANETVYISDLKALPIEIVCQYPLFTLNGIESLLLVPVFNKNSMLGFLGFDAIKTKKKWSNEHNEALKIIANILSDALVKVDAEKTILDMAYYDALTGLSNRAYFTIQFDKMIELASRKHKLIGVLFLDLDDFKTINDTKGHDVGDSLLKIVSERITSIVRKSDVVCRFGGDEFLIMLPLMDALDQIKETTQKIMSVFEKPVRVNDQNFYITASCGVSVYPADGYDSKTLIKSADLAMYASKASGKNRYSFCTPVMMQAVKEKMELTNDLYRALERNEFTLFYQPQVNTETLNIIGLEALIRWNHPTRGMVSPFEFIALAEQTGLIHAIGEWVIKTACLQNKAWQDGGFTPVVMAANLSVEQFRDTKLIEIVSSALKESGLDPKYLELEITESIAIKEPAYIIDVLNQLKALGVSISVDDFGTAYSSLSRIKELPIDRLKIAMEFVQGIGNGTKDEEIAIVIINLAKRLNLKVIAEGVEMESQLTFLRNQHCDEVQGYYFYRPMPAKDIETMCLDELSNKL